MAARRAQVASAALEALIAELTRHYKQAADGQLPQPLIAAIGMRVGASLAERYTREKGRMAEALDVIKWACKELWGELFQKQVDSLRTNHRGTFVLKDNHFRWTRNISADPAEQGAAPIRLTAADVAAEHLHLPCAIIRGALQALSVDSNVTADATNLPAVDFTIVIRQQQR